MIKKRKNILIVAGGIIGLAIVVFLYITIITNQYRDRIPEVDYSNLSSTVKEQIYEAYNKAHRKPTANNLGELGMVYHSSAMYNQAVQCYKLAIKKNKSDWKWSYYLGYLNMELGNSDEVVANFKRVIEINPDMDLARYYLGEAYRNLRKYDLAEKTFIKIINTDNISAANINNRNNDFPLRVYAMYQLSKIYFDTERLELAEETLKQLLTINDLFGPAYRLLGNIYNMKGDIALGEEYGVRANDLLLFSPPIDDLIDKLALLSRSELYLLKKIDEAERNVYREWSLTLVEQGLKYIPDNKHLISKAIKIYLANNLRQKAIGLVDKHTNSIIDDFPELISVGNLFFQKGLYNEAIKYWTKALSSSPDDVNLYKNSALCFWKTGDKQKAAEILTKATEKYQDNPENLADIIFAFLQFENMEKANEYLKKLKQLSPDNPKVQKINGKIAENRGNIMGAISMYEASFKGNPKDDEVIHFLSGLLVYKEMWNKYLELYTEAIKHNPNNPVLLEKLGAFLVSCPDKSLRNLNVGIKYSIRAFTNKDSSLDIVLSSGKNLSLALVTIGDKQNALNIIKQTINRSRRSNTSDDIKRELEQLYRAIQKL